MIQYPSLSRTKSIICVGCLSVDVIHICDVLPDEGAEVTCLQAHWRRGGHASNVSYTLRMLGAQVVFLGMLSRSNLLIDFVQKMRANNIVLDHCPKTDEQPAFSAITEAKKGGYRCVVNCNKNFPYVTAQHFKAINLDQCGWAHFEGRNLQDTIQMMRVVRDYNNGRDQRVIISLRVNAHYRKFQDLFFLCDYVIFSGRLAQRLGWQSAEVACRELDNDLRMPRSIKLRRPCIVCTWGMLGAGCLGADGVYVEIPACPVRRVVETYGAGECFTATFIYAIHVRSMCPRLALELANRVTSHKIGGFGYSHLATFNTYPSLQDDQEDTQPNSEDSAGGDLLCRKYLQRVVNYSDGRAATLLMDLFDEETVDKVKRVEEE